MKWNKLIIIIYMILIFLVPDSLKFSIFSYSKILTIISVIIFVYLLFYNKGNNINKIKENKLILLFIKILFIFAFVIFLSFIYNSFLNNNFFFSDIYEIVRCLLYALIMINVYLLYYDNKKMVVNTIIILTLINCFIGITQFFNPYNINELYIKFIAPTQYVTLINKYSTPRILGLVANPNTFAMILTLTNVLILYLIVKEPKKLWYYISFFIIRITIYLTFSRSGFIVTIIGELSVLFFMLFDTNKLKKKISKILKYILIISLFELLLLLILPESVTWRVKELFNFQNINSWKIRQRNSEETISEIIQENPKETISEIIQENPKETINEMFDDENKFSKYQNDRYNNVIHYLIGFGPDKMKLYTLKSIDNEWLKIFIKYGTIGLGTYLVLFLLPLFKMIKNLRKFSSLYFSLILISFIFMYPAGIFHSYKTFSLLVIIIAISFYDVLVECKDKAFVYSTKDKKRGKNYVDSKKYN